MCLRLCAFCLGMQFWGLSTVKVTEYFELKLSQGSCEKVDGIRDSISRRLNPLPSMLQRNVMYPHRLRSFKNIEYVGYSPFLESISLWTVYSSKTGVDPPQMTKARASRPINRNQAGQHHDKIHVLCLETTWGPPLYIMSIQGIEAKCPRPLDRGLCTVELSNKVPTGHE